MRILATGFVVFVIWCFISAWLYNDVLLPAIRKPVMVLTTPENQIKEADSLMRLREIMPEDILIYFKFNESSFIPDTQTGSSLSEFKAWVEKYSGSMVTVTGHTDIVGTPEYNRELGLKRAQAVSKYIETQGISSSRIITQSAGETEAGADYITPEGRARNRKTVISIKL